MSLQEEAFQCLATFRSLSILCHFLIEAGSEFGEIGVLEDVTPGHMTCAWNGDHSGGKANLLCAVVSFFAIDEWDCRILCTMDHDERWLAVESANVRSFVNSIVNSAT